MVAVLQVGNVAYLAPSGKILRQGIFWQDGWRRALEAAGLEDFG